MRRFWDASPCGSTLTEAKAGTPEFFAEVERSRYELEPFIERFAEFREAAGDRVLEIGVGLGTDLIQFARRGANVTGVDLAERSIELAKRRFELEGLEADLLVADAEQLPFADGSFDRVYSWGVLHHTPRTAVAVREAIRVLRPGGRLCVMLYGRRSWVAFAFWARFALLRGRPWMTIGNVLARYQESEGTKAFTKREVREMFEPLRELQVQPHSTPYDRRYAGPLAKVTGNSLGWFLIVQGVGPDAITAR